MADALPRPLGIEPGGPHGGPTARARLRRRFLRHRSGMFGALVVVIVTVLALFAPQLAPKDPNAMNILGAYRAPSTEHWFGTDEFGRDVLSRVIYGARIVFRVPVTATVLAAVVGTVLGLLAGFLRGPLDLAVMRFADLILAFPSFLLAVALVAVIGPSVGALVVVISVTRLPAFIRIARGEVLRLAELDFVSAASALGSRRGRVMFRHVLPNALSPLIVLSSLTLGDAILTVAALSFLGIGIQAPTSDWGLMLSRSREYLFVAPWLPFVPGVAVFLTVMGFNLLGDAIRDVFDPRGA